MSEVRPEINSDGQTSLRAGCACPRCGYDLTGSPTWVCPECGGTVTPLDTEKSRRRREYLARPMWQSGRVRVLLLIAFFEAFLVAPFVVFALGLLPGLLGGRSLPPAARALQRKLWMDLYLYLHAPFVITFFVASATLLLASLYVPAVWICGRDAMSTTLLFAVVGLAGLWGWVVLTLRLYHQWEKQWEKQWGEGAWDLDRFDGLDDMFYWSAGANFLGAIILVFLMVFGVTFLY